MGPDDDPERPAEPDARQLRDWAIAYLGRYAASTRRLADVLERRLLRRGFNRETARSAIVPVVADMVALGAVDDAAFARQRADALMRKGVAPGVARGRLKSEGLDPDALGSEATGQAAEVAAALAFMRRKRLGAYGSSGSRRGPDALTVMCRAGHGAALARRLLAATDTADLDAVADSIRSDF